MREKGVFKLRLNQNVSRSKRSRTQILGLMRNKGAS